MLAGFCTGLRGKEIVKLDLIDFEKHLDGKGEIVIPFVPLTYWES